MTVLDSRITTIGGRPDIHAPSFLLGYTRRIQDQHYTRTLGISVFYYLQEFTKKACKVNRAWNNEGSDPDVPAWDDAHHCSRIIFENLKEVWQHLYHGELFWLPLSFLYAS